MASVNIYSENHVYGYQITISRLPSKKQNNYIVKSETIQFGTPIYVCIPSPGIEYLN